MTRAINIAEVSPTCQRNAKRVKTKFYAFHAVDVSVNANVEICIFSSDKSREGFASSPERQRNVNAHSEKYATTTMVHGTSSVFASRHSFNEQEIGGVQRATTEPTIHLTFADRLIAIIKDRANALCILDRATAV